MTQKNVRGELEKKIDVLREKCNECLDIIEYDAIFGKVIQLQELYKDIVGHYYHPRIDKKRLK